MPRRRQPYKHPLAVSIKANDTERAAELSAAGADQYRWAWLRANEIVVRIFREYDIDTEHNRALGMELATAICQGPNIPRT